MINQLPTKYKPAVSRPTLMISSGLFWLIGAVVLFYRGYEMLSDSGEMLAILAGVGLVLGAIKYRFVLSKVVIKNADRIRELAPYKERVCIFAFQPLQSYFLVIIMMGLGFGARALFDAPKILGTIFIAIGAALTLGGLQYYIQSRKKL